MQKFFAALVGLLLLTLPSRAQTAPVADSTRPKTYTYTEKMPVFPVLAPGDSAVPSNQRFLQFLRDSLRVLPQLARDGVRGRASFSFTINAQGRTENIKLVKGLRADADAEVLRSAHRLDRIQWQPGTQNGRPVSVSFTVPISFNLPAKPALPDSLQTSAYNTGTVPVQAWGTNWRIFPSNQGVVYGSCIQRLGFESSSFRQYVRLANLTTGKPVVIEVKPARHSRKQNAFCFALPPGQYALYKYEFTASKWYGGQLHEENLRKAPSPKAADGRLSATRYLFTVAAGQLHYLGTWNLEQENAPVFLNEKAQLDAQLLPLFKNISFDAAMVALPQ